MKRKPIDIFRAHGGQLRMREALEHGICRYMLYALRDKGRMPQVRRAFFQRNSPKQTMNHFISIYVISSSLLHLTFSFVSLFNHFGRMMCKSFGPKSSMILSFIGIHKLVQ